MRLQDIATINPRVEGLGRDAVGDTISFLPLDRIWADARFDPSDVIEFSGEVASYNPVAEGDVLLPKVAPTFAHRRVAVASGLVGGRALATSEVFVIRPRGHDAARFLAYRLRAKDFIDEGVASWTGVAGLKRISADFVRGVRISPEVWEKRGQITDFLDRECDRIARLCDVLARLELTASEMVRHSFAAAVIDVATIPLRRWMTSISDGPFGSLLASEHYVDAPGVRVIRLGDIGTAEIRENSEAYVSESYACGPLAGHRVRSGDVVMAGLGDANHRICRAAVVPAELDQAVHKADCYRVTLDLRRACPEFVAWALSFGPARDRAALLSRGSTRARLNTVVARELPMPALALERQQRLVRDVKRSRSVVNATRAGCRALAVRLTEYQNALITEAVTGHLDVTKISEAQMGERAHAAAAGAAPTDTSTPTAQ